MEAVHIRFRRFQQVRVDQDFQRLSHVAAGLPGQRRRGGPGDGRSRPQAEQPEHPGGIDGSRPHRPRQAGETHLEGRAHSQVPGPQLVQPVPFIRQPVGHRPDRPAAAPGQPGAGDPDCQRQASACRQHAGGGFGLSARPALARDPAEQGTRLRRWQ